MSNQQHARKPVKTISSCRVLATCKLQTSFSALVQPDNHVVQKFDTRKIHQLSNEVIFFAPSLSVSPFLLLNLSRRQCYASAIGLFTRPKINSCPIFVECGLLILLLFPEITFCSGTVDNMLTVIWFLI